jgi:hypothetical protein
MARKPNYAFERNTRAKAKAEKREAKRQAKLAAKTEDPDDDTESNGADADDGPVTETQRAE